MGREWARFTDTYRADNTTGRARRAAVPQGRRR